MNFGRIDKLCLRLASSCVPFVLQDQDIARDKAQSLQVAVSAFEEMKNRAQLDFKSSITDSAQLSRENLEVWKRKEGPPHTARLTILPAHAARKAALWHFPCAMPTIHATSASVGGRNQSHPPVTLYLLALPPPQQAAERARQRLAEIVAKADGDARERVKKQQLQMEMMTDARKRSRFVRRSSPAQSPILLCPARSPACIALCHPPSPLCVAVPSRSCTAGSQQQPPTVPCSSHHPIRVFHPPQQRTHRRPQRRRPRRSAWACRLPRAPRA